MRKPPTINDVAVALGMHKSTVSLALSGKGTISSETRRRVLSVAHELGYEPNAHAQRLAQGQTGSTVCIFSGVLDVGLATEKILLLQQALTVRGLETPLYTGYTPSGGAGEAQAAQVKQLCRLRPRALVCAALRVHPLVLRELEIFQRGGGLVITYDTPVPLACDQVIFDREHNAYQAARHLLEQGHRRIGLGMSQVSDVTPGLNSSAGQENLSDPQPHRLRGFRRALAEYGLNLRDDWFFRTTTYEKGGAEMAQQFLQLQERPTALAIVNDYVAMAFMVEVMRAGVRIPHELSVIGHDDQPIAAYCPVPLTTMTQPVERIVQAVADFVIDRTTGEAGAMAAPRKTLLTGELIQRDSIAAPHHS